MNFPSYMLFASLPWIALLLFVLVRFRTPRALPTVNSGQGDLPSVSVIVPARNEERSIRSCVESICASDYPDFEVIVVDDRSADGTLSLARGIGANRARWVVVVEGEALPEGWFGKPWACAQGARAAQGSLLLFTDADTIHSPELLGRAVAGLAQDESDALTLMGRQLMETFWERVIQTHMFVLMIFRYPDLRRPCLPARWRDAIANGQYILFERGAYEEIGGHGAVRREVVEDQRLAQTLCKAGKRLSVREAEAIFVTRMYRSLGELVEGWTKNVSLGSRQGLPSWAAPFVMPLAIVTGTVLWILPPVVLAVSMAGLGLTTWVGWASWITGLSVGAWALSSWRVGAPPALGIFYPLGTAMVTYIFFRSWVRGGHVEWKGREYHV